MQPRFPSNEPNWKSFLEQKILEFQVDISRLQKLLHQLSAGESGFPQGAGGEIIPASGSGSLKRAKTSSTLPTSGTGTAVCQDWDGSAWVDSATTITVRFGIPAVSALSTNRIVWYTEVSVGGTVYNFVISAQCS